MPCNSATRTKDKSVEGCTLLALKIFSTPTIQETLKTTGNLGTEEQEPIPNNRDTRCHM